MAKKQIRETRKERLIHCSGPNWEGDGSKESSACKFGDSMQSTAERYKCSHCATGTSPEGVFAGPNGIRKIDPIKALKNKEDQVLQMSEMPAPAIEPEILVESLETVETAPVETEAERLPKKVAAKRRKKRRRF